MRKANNLAPSCAIVTKSGKFNFLEPSGPLQASNGTAFYLSTILTSARFEVLAAVCLKIKIFWDVKFVDL